LTVYLVNTYFPKLIISYDYENRLACLFIEGGKTCSGNAAGFIVRFQ